MKKLLFLLVFVLAISCYAQNFVFPYPMIQKPGFWTTRTVTTLSDSTHSTTQTIDYLFIDTTGNVIRTTFAGAPVTIVFEPTLTNGTESDSLSITIDPLVYYNSVDDSFYTAIYDYSGATTRKTVWSNYDWIDSQKYIYPYAVNYPIWGIRINITYSSILSNGYLYHHIIIQ